MTEDWRKVPEAGSTSGIAFVATTARRLGRRVARLVLLPVVLYFVLVRPEAVAAIAEFRRHAGARNRPIDQFRHVLRFAQCALDRLFFLMGEVASIRTWLVGHEHLVRARQSGRGAILLGAHLGSFEAMRARARDTAIPITIVADFASTRALNAILERYGDNSGTKFLDANANPIELALGVQEAVERGELVAILADRIGRTRATGDRAAPDRAVEVDFLGGRILLPTGPYLLAATVGCPVYLTLGIHHPPNRYELFCEPFAEKIELPRGARRQALQTYAQKYARRLEHYCRLAPDNWFNFFPYFLATDVGTSPSPRSHDAAA